MNVFSLLLKGTLPIALHGANLGFQLAVSFLTSVQLWKKSIVTVRIEKSGFFWVVVLKTSFYFFFFFLMLSIVLVSLTKTIVKIQVISKCVIHVWMWIAKNLIVILYYFSRNLGVRYEAAPSHFKYFMLKYLTWFSFEINIYIGIWRMFCICNLKIFEIYIYFL